MPTQEPDDPRMPLLQGTLDLLILRTLIFGAQHGQGIARAIQQQSNLATCVAVSIFLAGFAILASYVPARKALRVDQVQALRCEWGAGTLA